MRVSEVMSRDVEYVDVGETAQAAAALMGEIDVGALPVGSPERPLGVITTKDMVFRVCARGLDSSRTLVSEVMSHSILACDEDDEVGAALDLMAAYHVRRLFVKDGSGTVVGWITLSDLARRLLVDSELVQRGLDDLSRIAA
ncbi:CBS domain-containing protein [Novosphingobium sp. RD2P27]|uniref:CBS domain-containing protein n=1 Tax=Novosphingobium kalidii TaxID=3230299 RepID=A0ABV2D396_9SPHN